MHTMHCMCECTTMYLMYVCVCVSNQLLGTIRTRSNAHYALHVLMYCYVLHVCVCMCVRMCLYVYVSVYVCVCVKSATRHNTQSVECTLCTACVNVLLRTSYVCVCVKSGTKHNTDSVKCTLCTACVNVLLCASYIYVCVCVCIYSCITRKDTRH